MHPYNILTTSSLSCYSKCDGDRACNGYSIDESNNGCFLSSCNIYIEVPSCSTCKFASKQKPTSDVSCSQASDLPPSATMTGIDVTNLPTHNVSCVCVCKDVNQTIEESIERRRNELFLNKTKLSSVVRKLTSAQDYRMSSKVIGTISTIILVLFGMLFFCADIFSVLSLFFRKCLIIFHLSK